MHPLQHTFATAAGEEAWAAQLAGLMAEARLAEAEAILAPLVADLHGEMGLLCESARADISGFDELADAISQHEGAPITGMTIAIGNDADMAFEKGVLHRPYAVLGLYTDGEEEAEDAPYGAVAPFAWSQATREALLAQIAAEGGPAWTGCEEDIEVHIEIEGLDALNTALVHHKQRHLLRDGEMAQAPLRYVEFVLGGWWRALLYHRAVARALADNPLPGRVTVVSGMVDMRPDVIAIMLPGAAVAKGDAAGAAPVRVAAAPSPSAQGAQPEAAFAGLAGRDLIQRGVLVEEKPLTGVSLRQRVAASEQEQPPEPARPSLLQRLFGRG